MAGVRSIAMTSVRTDILSYSLKKNLSRAPCLPFHNLLFILGKNFSNQNDVEFDFSRGHALEILVSVNNKHINVK